MLLSDFIITTTVSHDYRIILIVTWSSVALILYVTYAHKHHPNKFNECDNAKNRYVHQPFWPLVSVELQTLLWLHAKTTVSSPWNRVHRLKVSILAWNMSESFANTTTAPLYRRVYHIWDCSEDRKQNYYRFVCRHSINGWWEN